MWPWSLMSAVHLTACEDRQGDRRINKLWPDPPIRVVLSDSLSAPFPFFLMPSSYWQCQKTKSPKFRKKRLLDKCFGISFKLRSYQMPRCKEEKESKVWDPILEGRFWETERKITIGATEYEIHIGYILYLYFIDCVCFYKSTTYLIIKSFASWGQNFFLL